MIIGMLGVLGGTDMIWLGRIRCLGYFLEFMGGVWWFSPRAGCRGQANGNLVSL